MVIQSAVGEAACKIGQPGTTMINGRSAIVSRKGLASTVMTAFAPGAISIGLRKFDGSQNRESFVWQDSITNVTWPQMPPDLRSAALGRFQWNSVEPVNKKFRMKRILGLDK